MFIASKREFSSVQLVHDNSQTRVHIGVLSMRFLGFQQCAGFEALCFLTGMQALQRHHAQIYIHNYISQSDIQGGKEERDARTLFMFPNPGVPYSGIGLESVRRLPLTCSERLSSDVPSGAVRFSEIYWEPLGE